MADALVDVLFFLIAYPILATPLKQLLPPLIGPLWTATFITVVVNGITVLATLQRAQISGRLDPMFADREVWRRLAA